MFKRVLLSLTFVAALAAASFVPARPAEAWRNWGRPYVGRSYYYGPRYYGGYAPYRTYYRSYYAGPAYSPYYYSQPYYAYPYGGYPYGAYYGGPGVAVSFGF